MSNQWNQNLLWVVIKWGFLIGTILVAVVGIIKLI
jgi:hypothetical protein